MRHAYQRTVRISDIIKREVADILSRDVKDPRLGFITITQVTVAKDLKNARVFFTTMREGQELDALQEGLQHAAGFVQRKLGARLQLRHTPHITFIYDTSVAQGIRMNKILTTLEQKLDTDEE